MPALHRDAAMGERLPPFLSYSLPFSLLSGHGRQAEWPSLRSHARARGHAGEPPAMAGRRPCTRTARVDGGPDQWVPPGSLPVPYPFLPPPLWVIDRWTPPVNATRAPHCNLCSGEDEGNTEDFQEFQDFEEF
jgi:hypothetical protein